MSGMGTMKQQASRMPQQQPRAGQPLSEVQKQQLRATGCGGRQCGGSTSQRVFFQAQDPTRLAQITRQLKNRGCSQQCVDRGYSFYCCPPSQSQAIDEVIPEADVPVVDDIPMDPFMLEPGVDDMYMDAAAMAPIDEAAAVVPVAEGRRIPWLFIGVGVVGLGVIGYLLATRK